MIAVVEHPSPDLSESFPVRSYYDPTDRKGKSKLDNLIDKLISSETPFSISYVFPSDLIVEAWV